MSSVALPSRASFREVARLGSVVSGILSRCCNIFRSSFDKTVSVGIRSRSESESAKLSPTQLNSPFPDVFSNGSTITTSVAGCVWADAITAPSIKIIANNELFLIINFPKNKNSPDTSEFDRTIYDAKLPIKDGIRYGI